MFKGLGHELHQKALEKAENEKLEAIQRAEQAVREDAEQLKVITEGNIMASDKRTVLILNRSLFYHNHHKNMPI